jgi:hypothetical protein
MPFLLDDPQGLLPIDGFPSIYEEGHHIAVYQSGEMQGPTNRNFNVVQIQQPSIPVDPDQFAEHASPLSVLSSFPIHRFEYERFHDQHDVLLE